MCRNAFTRASENIAPPSHKSTRSNHSPMYADSAHRSNQIIQAYKQFRHKPYLDLNENIR